MEECIGELVLDVETTFQKLPKNKSSNLPFDPRNKLVCIAYHDSISGISDCVVNDADGCKHLISSLQSAKLVIGFNFKFDYHWLRHAGIDLSNHRIWDCQLAEFILHNQVGAMPSLDECLAAHGLPLKFDIVKEEYWKKGKNTDEVPWDILSEYASEDARLTYLLYQKQRQLLTPQKQKLLSLMCQDLHILQEMEWNGLKYNEQLCNERSDEISKKITSIHTELNSIYPDVPINFNSSDQLSAFLYGGIIKQESKEHVGFFKGGVKQGQPKYKNIVIEHQLPRVYTPLRGSEMAKEGIYSTDEGTLKKLKGNKHRVGLLLELAKLTKLIETYYDGIPSLNKEMNWEANMIHGNLNQTTAVTGRLSSSKPNLQNFASELQDIFITRY